MGRHTLTPERTAQHRPFWWRRQPVPVVPSRYDVEDDPTDWSQDEPADSPGWPEDDAEY